MTCRRCGEQTPRLTLTQRYCPRCEREMTRSVPEWRRRLPAKDLTHAH